MGIECGKENWPNSNKQKIHEVFKRNIFFKVQQALSEIVQVEKSSLGPQLSIGMKKDGKIIHLIKKGCCTILSKNGQR